MLHTPPLPRALHAPRDYRVLYVDMNSFFASIEQQDHPEFREKPIAVVSHIHPRGTVLAASYEAKYHGILTGMKVEAARALVPSLALREVHPFRYKQVHEQVMNILQELCGPGVQPKSIDEAVIYLPSNWQTASFSADLAMQIKTKLATEIGSHIRCSIGIAPNRLLGKLGTELKKPDGLTTITLASTRDQLSNLPLTALNGIAERYAATLVAHNITTPQEFYDAPAEMLRSQFGAWGQYWWWRLHGFECDGHIQNEPLHSMSHEHVLKKRVTTKYELEALLGKMVDKLCYRLQRNQLQCRSVGILLRWSTYPRTYFEATLDAPSNNVRELTKRYCAFLDQFPPSFPDSLRKLTILMNHLNPSIGYQPTLWQSQVIKSEKLGPALSLVRSKFGYASITTASSLVHGAAIMKPQLGFGRIGDAGNLE